MMQNVKKTVSRNAGPIAAIGALVLIGGLVGLSAPRNAAPTNNNNTAASSSLPLVTSTAATPQASKTASGSSNAPHTLAPSSSTPVATDTPVPPPPPTPTATPQPTATAAQPGWHSVGTFSGNGAGQAVTTITGLTGTQQNIRVDWTCQDPSGEWQIGFGIEPTGGSLAGATGKWCGGPPTGNQNSTDGSLIFNADTNANGSNWTVLMVDNSDAGGPWTATVYIWY